MMRSSLSFNRCLALLAVLIASSAPAHAQSKRALAELGRVVPPSYGAPLVRAGDPAPVFEQAMRTYALKQYGPTADLLRRFAATEPDDPAGNFFLAVSLMMIDEVGEAEDRLNAVLAVGKTPFERPARFVLAKAAIRFGKLDAAERELTVLADGADHYALDSAGLLPRVRALRKRE
jgi:predicted Zn-dependent protease